jgi:hypothetical protein
MRTLKNLLTWFVVGKDSRVYIFQPPNIPIIGWFLSVVIATFIASGSVKVGFSNLSLGFLAIWSYLEITQGQSRFRKMLGAAVAILTMYSFFK